MKNLPTKNSTRSNVLNIVYFILFVGFIPTMLHSQNYRNIEAYMDDFSKNELYVKKSLMDYSVSIVESQLYSRTKTTSERILEKLEKINTIIKNNNKGFEGNTSLRDGFIKMNLKTIDCLKNGSLILNDYDYQSNLSLTEIGENFNQKETDLIAYYQELKKYETTKKAFTSYYKMNFKSNYGKNILEYNAYQNILFYKMNVIDEKLSSVILSKDKKGFSNCMNMIALMHQEIMQKTNQYKSFYKDTSLNNANIEYSIFMASQKEKLNSLFNDYVNEYNSLQTLRNMSKPETTETIAAYNDSVRQYNTKKNLFYAVFDENQSIKDKLYGNWLIINSTFLKNNGKFYTIYEQYAFDD